MKMYTGFTHTRTTHAHIYVYYMFIICSLLKLCKEQNQYFILNKCLGSMKY